MRRGMNLIFNSDSLIITTKHNSYRVTIVKINRNNYWNIKSNNHNNRIICKDGNIDELLKYIYNMDKDTL